MTAALITMGVLLAMAVEFTFLQAEETNLASNQPTTVSTLTTSWNTGPHNVTFVESGSCGPGGRPSGWAISEWGVTFDNVTKTYPSNASLSQIQQGHFTLYFDSNQSSSITFAVPDGSYSYQLYPDVSGASNGPLEVSGAPPSEFQAQGPSGDIIVSGFDLEFCLTYPAVVAGF